MIFYESPYRVVKTLRQLAEYFGGDRQMSACREISKIHEESVRGTIDEVAAHFEEVPPKGEFVLVVAGADEEKLKDAARDRKQQDVADGGRGARVMSKYKKKKFSDQEAGEDGDSGME